MFNFKIQLKDTHCENFLPPILNSSLFMVIYAQLLFSEKKIFSLDQYEGSYDHSTPRILCIHRKVFPAS